MGLVTDSDTTNKNYKMLYKASLSDKTHIEYIIDIYEEEFHEQLIEDFLNNRSNKRSLLKTIFIEKNKVENEEKNTPNPNKSETPEGNFLNESKKSKNYLNSKALSKFNHKNK